MSKVAKVGKTKHTGLYFKNVIARKVKIPFKYIGGNIEKIINNKLKEKFEGKCINEGYIKKHSIDIITYSSGLVDGNKVIFDVVFQCLACRPVEGMKIQCTIKNITSIIANIVSHWNPLLDCYGTCRVTFATSWWYATFPYGIV